jgi:hypothetical protein
MQFGLVAKSEELDSQLTYCILNTVTFTGGRIGGSATNCFLERVSLSLL